MHFENDKSPPPPREGGCIELFSHTAQCDRLRRRGGGGGKEGEVKTCRISPRFREKNKFCRIHYSLFWKWASMRATSVLSGLLAYPPRPSVLCIDQQSRADAADGTIISTRGPGYLCTLLFFFGSNSNGPKFAWADLCAVYAGKTEKHFDRWGRQITLCRCICAKIGHKRMLKDIPRFLPWNQLETFKGVHIKVYTIRMKHSPPEF